MGQHIGTQATLSDGSDADLKNREIFEEAVEIVLKAWTEESIEHNSERWQIPFPYDGGHRGWFMAPWTEKLGAHGERIETVRGVGYRFVCHERLSYLIRRGVDDVRKRGCAALL